MSRRRGACGAGLVLGLICVGALLAAVVPGITGQLLGLILVGLGLVFAVSWAFLEVGLSEDRERAGRPTAGHGTPARSRPPHRPPAPGPATAHPPARTRLQSSRRLPRSRGEHRRLR